MVNPHINQLSYRLGSPHWKMMPRDRCGDGKMIGASIGKSRERRPGDISSCGTLWVSRWVGKRWLEYPAMTISYLWFGQWFGKSIGKWLKESWEYSLGIWIWFGISKLVRVMGISIVVWNWWNVWLMDKSLGNLIVNWKGWNITDVMSWN